MKISIIVPFYNVEPYFRRCLDSIINQSYQNLEIILVNDCSPDNSIAIAREYAQKDPRIKIIEHEKNLRQGGARNSGMAVASGEYIWFLDSDDEMATPYAVEHLVSIAKRDDAEVIIFNAVMMDDERKTRLVQCFYPYATEQIFNDKRPFYPVFRDIMMYGAREQGYFSSESCFRLFRLSFLREYQFQFLEHTIHEDLPHLAWLPLAQNVTIVPYIFYNYYQRGESTMHSPLPVDYMDHLACLLRQVDSIYATFWIDKNLPKTPLTILMLFHSVEHASRLSRDLNKGSDLSKRDAMLRFYYDLLLHHASDLSSELEDVAWPTTLIKANAWRELFLSFNQSLNPAQKSKIIKKIIKVSKLKSVGKWLLPHGIIMWLLNRRGWQVEITSKYR